MATYQILQDIEQFNLFLDFLPNLEINEQFYYCLFARSKYSKEIVHIKSDKQQLCRGIAIKAKLEKLLRQMECPIGSYVQNETIIPQEALACYININPRSFVKATRNCLIEFAKQIGNTNNYLNPYQTVISEIQKSCSRKVFLDFDFDIEQSEIDKRIAECDEVINKSATTIIRTRGGFHYLIEVEKIDPKVKNKFYQKIVSLSGCDNKGDNMLPIPGTYQGGFVPFFYRIKGTDCFI